MLDKGADGELFQGAVPGHQRVPHGGDDGDVTRTEAVDGCGHVPAPGQGTGGGVGAREAHPRREQRLQPETRPTGILPSLNICFAIFFSPLFFVAQGLSKLNTPGNVCILSNTLPMYNSVVCTL